MNIVSTIVGAGLNLMLMGGIASGLMSVMAVQGSTQALAEVTSQATSTEAAWRSDTTWALAVHPGGIPTEGSGARDTEVTFVTAPTDQAPAGVLCTESTWRLGTDGSGRTQVVNELVHHRGTYADATKTCSGTALTPVTQVLVNDAGDLGTAVRIDYANPAGRVFRTDGTLDPAEARPAGVLPALWNAAAVEKLMLTAGSGVHTDYATTFTVEQRLENLRITPGSEARASAGHTPVESVFLGTGALTP